MSVFLISVTISVFLISVLSVFLMSVFLIRTPDGTVLANDIAVCVGPSRDQDRFEVTS